MYPVKGARDSSPPRSVVSYTVRNSSRRLLVLLARRSIGGQSLQDGPSAALRRGRVLAGDQIAVDDHVWVASRPLSNRCRRSF